MSKFPSFLEYLNDKGNLVEKPDVETVPDYHGPDEKNPPNSKVPYKTPVANKAPQKGESGLSELGDDKLKYEPDTKLNYKTQTGSFAEGLKRPTRPATTTPGRSWGMTDRLSDGDKSPRFPPHKQIVSKLGRLSNALGTSQPNNNIKEYIDALKENRGLAAMMRLRARAQKSGSLDSAQIADREKAREERRRRGLHLPKPKEGIKEYVDEKGKVLEKGREDIKADYKGKTPKSPEGSDYSYVADDQKIKVGEKGLGELGEKEFEYNPDTKNAKKVTKTENFLNKTKGMSLSEFTSYMLEECGCGQVNDETLPFITAYTTGKFQPHPPEAIRYVSILADKNQGILENLVSQMISMGYLNKLLKTIFEHPQAYEELTNLFSDKEEGPERCNSFVGSMNNSYSKFLSDQDDLYESVSSPVGFDIEDMESEEDMEDMESEEDMEDMESEEDMEDMESEEDMEDMESEEDMEDMESEEDMEDMPKEKRLKKKFAHDHLLNAMRNHEHMLKAMRGI